MSSLKLMLAGALLLATGAVLGTTPSDAPAQPFWELQGSGPGARENGAVLAYRDAARPDPAIVIAAR